MKRSKFPEEQIVYALRQADSGPPISDLCRQLGIAEQTFYAWKKKYAHLGVSERYTFDIPANDSNCLQFASLSDVNIWHHDANSGIFAS
ncbi:MAG: transposase [Nitrospira defluvii]|nr:transposase [Nitrospira defluvii]